MSLTGFRLDDASGEARSIAAGLQETASDLARLAARPHDARPILWGVCPDHGNTLTRTGGKTWCTAVGCGRKWGYDRLGMPCTEPTRWRVTDAVGAEALMCSGHAHDARKRLGGVVVIPLGHGDPAGSCDEGDGGHG